ncbi:Rieske (2Fe-2S) protein [Marinifilum sp.]|uniref:Rieske (2Fe-2S) protein n=1 Tax=Marinifilum sp. TaxID=2033137 RepID=UPI003BA92167
MLVNKPNLLYFFIFFSLCLGIYSCSKSTDEDEIIPDVYVSGTIHLEYYPDLNAVGNALYFDEIDTSTAYLGHGFLVVRTSNTEFAVYDASCTHDKDANEHLKIDGSFAECPICGSKFNLFTGWPFNGSVATHKLKEYKSSYSVQNNTLKVSN